MWEKVHSRSQFESDAEMLPGLQRGSVRGEGPRVLEAIATRRSVRDFGDREVGDDALFTLLEAGRAAPSVHNVQPWFFGIVRGEKKQAIAEVLRQRCAGMLVGFHAVMEQGAKIIDAAPAVMVVWNRCPLSCRLERVKDMAREYIEHVKSYEIQSVAAAIENIWLAATGLGLGMAWLGIPAFCEREINALLGVRGTLVAVLALGYPKGARGEAPTTRKALKDIAHFFC